MANKKNNTSNSVGDIDLNNKDSILKEMLRVYQNGAQTDSTNLEAQATESKIRQLKIIYETLENKELFDAKHGKELPIKKVEIEFIESNDKETVDEIAELEKQLANEVSVEVS